MFLKNGIIKIIKLIVNLIMSGFSGKSKSIFNLSFASDPILVQSFAYNMHAYQSLACETAINTDFSELFPLKRIYVKYKNAILLLIDGFFRT